MKGSPLIFTALLLPPLVVFLGHGYDLLVSYVAARNVAHGLSPYEGGSYPNPSYPSEIQGIGETPLWPLFLSMVYSLSAGDTFLFNALSKIPIIISLFVLYFLAKRSKLEHEDFYLLNAFVLMTTVAWGKPDVLATTLFLLALLNVRRASLSVFLLAVSLNFKPLALGAVPAFVAYYGLRRGLTFAAALVALSSMIFFAPFVLLGWSASTPVTGTINWLADAGGLSPLNILEYFYGWSYAGINPHGFVVGVPWISAVVLSSALISLKNPRDFRSLAWLSLLGSTVFLVLRPKVSEQNLILPFMLIHWISGRPVSTS
ncbi:MAG: hypothetical protein NZ988_04250, partial [Thaumarchaeota archaeon]|nr:hypothetical protein [Candidatus Calditenuaceae archaeon]MDW8187239.1 hypothetical protein [Nitrososphaerota archaeon]